MAEFSWDVRSPLDRALVAGAHGAGGIEAGVSLTEIRNFDLIQIMARRGKAADLAIAAKAQFGVAAPDAPQAVQAPDATLIWSGPDQFFVLSKGGKHTMDTLASAFSIAASLSDQSHARLATGDADQRARMRLIRQ